MNIKHISKHFLNNGDKMNIKHLPKYFKRKYGIYYYKVDKHTKHIIVKRKEGWMYNIYYDKKHIYIDIPLKDVDYYE